MPTLDIHLLGDFLLTYNGQPLTGVNTARLQSLLAYLLLHRHGPQSRQHLAFTFWPDTGEAQALTNLRNLLHKLRRALPQPARFLAVDAHSVQWLTGAPYTLDVADFEAAVTQDDESRPWLERAAALYRGDLLPSCYDEWIDPERDRLRQLAMDALERLIGLLEQEREVRAALSHAQHLLQLDPLRESTCCTIMRLYALRGDRAAALRTYREFVVQLQDELGVEPEADTRDLYARLLQASAAAAAAPPVRGGGQDHLPLVGRRVEWSLLADAWQRAARGGPATVLLTGEAGIGKTRLAEELIQWAERQGFAVASARCYAAEGALTYTPVIAWLRSPAIRRSLASLDDVWLGEMARLLPELLAERPDLAAPAPITQGWQHQRFYEALARAVWQAGSPLLLFVDNLHWADRGTLEWLHYLLRFDPSGKLLLVGTVRSEEVGPDHPLLGLLDALRRDAQVHEVTLSRLDSAETATLATHVAGRALTEEQAGRLYRETEGNPLFIVETMRSAADGQWWEGPGVEQARQQQDGAVHPLPPRVHAVIQHRLGQLSPPARDLAGVAATLGREFIFPVLAKASELAEDALVACLDELEQRRIVREHGADAYDFSHDKLREVAYNGLSAARRRLYHRRAAQALESVYRLTLDAVSGQMAAHYELAGQYEQAVPYYQRAAEVAQRVHANAEAIQSCRRALALVEGPARQDHSTVAALHERLGDLLHFVGRYEEAHISFLRALATASPGDVVTASRLQRKVGNTHRDQYRYPEAMAAYAAARQRLEVERPAAWPDAPEPGAGDMAAWQQASRWRQEWIQVLLETKMVHYWLGQVDASAELDRALQPVVERYGSPGQRADFYRLLYSMEFRRNRSVASAASVAAVQRALAILEEAGDHERIPSALFMVGFNLLWSGHPQEALEPLQAVQNLAEQNGDISLQARCLTYRTIALRRCEQVDEATQCAERSRAVAAEAHMPEYVALAEANLAWVAWRKGKPADAVQHGQAVLAHWRELPIGHASAPFQWTARWPLLALALDGGQTDVALDHARALLDPLQQALPESLADLLTCAVTAHNDPVTAAALLRQAVEQACRLRYL